MTEVKVLSEVTGLVIRIEAAVGAQVAEFDSVVLIESMKMEIPVSAPRAGTIVAVLVTEGALVSEGDVVAILNT